mmetsp:Transcript_126876/g.370981  ORF Transcript_126876/g.370981 Transcript_126876/m.370981 type:complete len:205 (+) Transcript_126876:412-1026(+)
MRLPGGATAAGRDGARAAEAPAELPPGPLCGGLRAALFGEGCGHRAAAAASRELAALRRLTRCRLHLPGPRGPLEDRNGLRPRRRSGLAAALPHRLRPPDRGGVQRRPGHLGHSRRVFEGRLLSAAPHGPPPADAAAHTGLLPGRHCSVVRHRARRGPAVHRHHQLEASCCRRRFALCLGPAPKPKAVAAPGGDQFGHGCLRCL